MEDGNGKNTIWCTSYVKSLARYRLTRVTNYVSYADVHGFFPFQFEFSFENHIIHGSCSPRVGPTYLWANNNKLSNINDTNETA